jgi:RNA polymerase subunit RPABC4/transcription elongation factor Spt4
VIAEQLEPILRSGAALLVGLVVGAWALAALWGFQDSARRSGSLLARYFVATWILVSGPLLLPLALGVYILVRPADSPADRRYLRLAGIVTFREAEATSCRACGARIDPGWSRCPACATWLAVQCQRCERLAPPEAEICPRCAWEPVGRDGDGAAEPAHDAPTLRGIIWRPGGWRHSGVASS